MISEIWENRLTAVEAELAQIKKRLEQHTVEQSAVSAPNPWLDVVFGVFKDDPLFDEAERHGRAWRDSQHIKDEDANGLA